MGDPNLLVKDIGILCLSILHLAASRGSSFLVQSPSLFIFHHMALLMMQSLINHNTISWANQLNTNSTYQTTGSFAEFNCKIHWNFHSAHYTHYIHSLQNKSWAISKTGNCCHRCLLFKYFLMVELIISTLWNQMILGITVIAHAFALVKNAFVTKYGHENFSRICLQI